MDYLRTRITDDDKYPSNIGGAVLFLSYILAALVLSTQAVLRICHGYNARKRTVAEKRSITILSIMALVSFSTLSYNMLSFLFFSYGGLFEDFANAIVNRPEVWWWTQLALLVSYEICLWMSQKFRHEGIPGLSNLFLISQILPISFTLNLAFLTIATAPAKPAHATASASQRKASSPTSSSDGSIQLFTAGIYLACLYSAPANAGTPLFIPIVTLIRMLLYSPYFLQDTTSSTSARTFVAVLGFALQLEQSQNVRAGGISLSSLVQTVFDHPAVRSIGQDAILAITSVAVYSSL